MALKQLAIDISADSISSSVHYSFDSSGKVIGCYGRTIAPSSADGAAAQAPVLHDNSDAHHHQPKRQHRIIGRQRLRRLMLEQLQPHTVNPACLELSLALLSPTLPDVSAGEVGRVCVWLCGGAARCGASAPERRIHCQCSLCVSQTCSPLVKGTLTFLRVCRSRRRRWHLECCCAAEAGTHWCPVVASQLHPTQRRCKLPHRAA